MYADPFPKALLTIVAFVCSLALPAFLQADEWSDPCCSIPHDVITNCDEIAPGFDPNDWHLLEDLFGKPNGYYHCDNQNWHELSPEVNLNSCGIGTINRRFRSYYYTSGWGSPTEVTCEQTITINAAHEYVIRFPPDAIAYCEEPEAEDIQFEEESCDLLAVSIKDMKFQTGTDACYKILRTYRVINWCEYDGHSDPIIIGRDEDCDDAPGDEAVWVIRRPDNKIYIDRTNNEHDYSPSANELDQYCGHTGHPGFWRKIWLTSGSQYYNSRGFYQYTQHLKVMDNIPPDLSVNTPDPFCSYSEDESEGCPGQVSISFSVNDECSQTGTVKVFLFENNVPVSFTAANDIADEVISGSYPNFTITQRLPIGQHSYEIHAKDGCGNTNAIRVPVEVVDCDPPSIVCLHGLSTSLMPLEAGTDIDGDGDIDLGAMEIWATDFVIDSYNDDCSGPISYSVNRVGETPNINQTNIIFTCDDDNEVAIEVYVWDKAHNPYQVQPDGTVGGPNFDFCRTYIKLDRRGICGEPDDGIVEEEENPDEEVVGEEEEEIVSDDPIEGMALIAGHISTPEGAMLMDVEVRLDGFMMIDTITVDTIMADTTMTDTIGSFAYRAVQMGGTYIVRPYRAGDDLNGINASDMAMLSRHLQGRDTLPTPYQLIAADLDNSGAIDAGDLTVLLKIMLGVSNSLDSTPSWRFVDAAYVFANEQNPWEEPFPEAVQIDHITTNHEDVAFYAIKMGDLNFSAWYGPTADGIEERKLNMPVELVADLATVTQGEAFSLQLKGQQSDIIAGQLTFKYDPKLLEFAGLPTNIPGYIDPKEGIIKLALLPEQSLSSDDNWLRLDFISHYTGALEQAIQLDPEGQNNQLVDKNYDIYPVQLTFNQPTSTTWLLRANYPNPFRDFTYFDLNLPESGMLRFEVFNAAGQRLFTQEKQVAAGGQQIRLSADQLPGKGLLWYRIRLNGQVQSGKMILME